MWIAVSALGRRGAASLIFASSSISASSVGSFIKKRTIYSKYAVPDHAKAKPAPWPYKERGYQWFHQFMLLDNGPSRHFDENSKLIIVEGNVGSGKSKLAKDLAERLGFHHIADPPFDDLFIDTYGDDRRLHYHMFPETCRDFDTRMFFEQPRHRNTAAFQKRRYMCRVEAFLNAQAHILNTGQGVVLERCYQTDKVFVDAMFNKGYLSDAFRWHYFDYLSTRINHDMKLEAHAVIYLDCPVNKCLENIKKHHKPWEWQNDVMDYQYLEDMEKGLKQWLKDYRRHGEILIYDASDGVDVNAVAEDVEQLDLDSYYVHKNEKFETWHLFPYELKFDEYRVMVTSEKWDVLSFFYVPAIQVEELMMPTDDMAIRLQMMNLLYSKFVPGFRPHRGDSRWDMAISFFRDHFNNKKWTEYHFQHEFHLLNTDMGFFHPGTYPQAPTWPEEFLKPRSPYVSDGGVNKFNELFLGDDRRLIHHG